MARGILTLLVSCFSFCAPLTVHSIGLFPIARTMDEVKAAPKEHPLVPGASRSREVLELRYIELLEQRIAALEALLEQKIPVRSLFPSWAVMLTDVCFNQAPIKTTATTEENIEKI